MSDTRPPEERAEAEPFAIGTRHRAPFERPRADRYDDRLARARAHPMEFDESGFPVPQHEHSMVDRVRRLLNV
jgi:hypothetical protein